MFLQENIIFKGFGVAEPRTRRKTVANPGEPMNTRKNRVLVRTPAFLTRGKPVETRGNS